MQSRDIIKEAVEYLKEAESLLVLTGAGVSVECGIPTFRGKDGLWNRYNPAELASITALNSNPERVWEWYVWRRKLIASKEPGPSHIAIKRLEDLFKNNFLLVTQNVDGLHRKAGSMRMVEFHGNIMRDVCTGCGHSREGKLEYSSLPPCCDRCGSLLKPGVVMFGESIPEDALKTAFSFAESVDLVITAGTSSIVYPAASIPEVAKASGAKLIEINPDRTPISSISDISIRATSRDALESLVKGLVSMNN